MRPSFVLRALSVLLPLLLVGCGSAKNTPEQAFEHLRTALREQKWDLLYDILPPEKQKTFDAQIEDVVAQFQMLLQVSPNEVEPAAKRELGMSLAEWKQLERRQQFAILFKKDAKLQLAEIGMNPDEILASTVKETSIVGDKAEFSLDDGKGHRSRLTFVLVNGYWRFEL